MARFARGGRIVGAGPIRDICYVYIPQMNYAVSDFDDIQTIFKQAELPAPLCIDYYKLGSDYEGNDIAQKISAEID